MADLWKNTLPGMPGGHWLQEGKERQRVAIAKPPEHLSYTGLKSQPASLGFSSLGTSSPLVAGGERETEDCFWQNLPNLQNLPPHLYENS